MTVRGYECNSAVDIAVRRTYIMSALTGPMARHYEKRMCVSV